MTAQNVASEAYDGNFSKGVIFLIKNVGRRIRI